jgi:hypothetical protein
MRATFAREHEDKRHGTVTLLAGIVLAVDGVGLGARRGGRSQWSWRCVSRRCWRPSAPTQVAYSPDAAYSGSGEYPSEDGCAARLIFLAPSTLQPRYSRLNRMPLGFKMPPRSKP